MFKGRPLQRVGRQRSCMMISFEAGPARSMLPVFLDREAGLNNLSPVSFLGRLVALRQLRYSLAAAQVVGGVLMIPEVRI